MMRLFNSKCDDIILLVDPKTVGDVKEEMKIFVKMAMKLGEKVFKATNHLPNFHIFNTVILLLFSGNEGREYFIHRQDIFWNNF